MTLTGKGHVPYGPAGFGNLSAAGCESPKMPTAALRIAPSAGPDRRVRQLYDPRPTTARLAQAIAEILAGARPAAQLAAIATPDVLGLLLRNSGRLRARPGAPPQRPTVTAVHVSEPCAGVAEACAVVNLGTRCRAIAFRLELAGSRWRCTAFAF